MGIAGGARSDASETQRRSSRLLRRYSGCRLRRHLTVAHLMVGGEYGLTGNFPCSSTSHF